ncbi:adenosylcobinamide-GDP ribazoletransferase [Fodinibius saliphilus]|uniref:adenosylcobinamide-GDP ribazoletransferase n=1 Tax=Fodinibius saliphilus TaxID=1920650 RepID=UPI00110950AB|nr:adenosylcobinamide-GDP ribazoletransferase [Fodinibius saliphilus]
MKRELQVFLTAVMFFTKIPCPQWVDHSPEFLNESARYFSLVGIIVGSVGAAVFWGFNFLFPQTIAVLLSMLATIWVTGAFHEDGLADMFDGFGGGWTQEQILSIMKDSRIGTFGVAGLTGILALKFLSLNELPPLAIPFLLIAGHAASRFFATTLIMTHDYVRGEPSKAKPVAQKMSPFSIILSAVFGLLPLFLIPHSWIWLSLIPMISVLAYLGWFFNKWIGGHTGDCSGATQQLLEVTFYLSAVIIWTFI